MPVLTLRKAAEELGYSSIQTIYNLEKKGLLSILRLPNAGGSRRKTGAARVASEQIEAFKKKHGIATRTAPTSVPSAPSGAGRISAEVAQRPMPISQLKLAQAHKKPQDQRPKRLLHFG